MSKIIGIDVSKQTFDVSFLENNQWKFFKLDNNLKGFKSLIKIASKTDKVIMEASGPYYLQLAIFLYEKGVTVVVENPLVIKRFSQAKLYRAKTDRKDAQIIAEYGERFEKDLKSWEPPSTEVLELRSMFTRVELLKKQIHQTKMQFEAFMSGGTLNPSLKKEMNSILKTLENSKKKLEKEIEDLANKEYKEIIECLCTIPGIGIKTATLLCIITDGFKKFENAKQLVAYVGFSPRVFQSGTSVKGKGHICKMGMSQIRKFLYLCSWSAKTKNKQCVELYQRLKEKGKPERVIKIAMANKLLRQAFAIGKNKIDYNENFVQNICI
ncbi:MAG: IS110 family transposase [Bacteroidales bacterium]|nr:IS110 family transposase [Bacteroidales bacterium]